jgi:hypothetical protein
VQLVDVPAGSKIDDLGFCCYDEAARPSPAQGATYTGRVMCGWMRKARKAVLSETGAMVMLPALQVPQEVQNLHDFKCIIVYNGVPDLWTFLCVPSLVCVC